MAWLAMVDIEGGRKSFVQCDRARHSGHLNFFPPQRSKNLAEKSAARRESEDKSRTCSLHC